MLNSSFRVLNRFNGDRLRAARVYRGKTIIELAEEIQVTKQSISQYEHGKANPSLETLLKLISTLGFPREYFYERDKEGVKIGSTFFRALLTTNKKDRLAQEERTKLLSKIYYVLNRYIEFPELNIPQIEESLTNIEAIAQRVRDHWQLNTSPIPNMVNLMEKNGFILTSFQNEVDKIDAFSQYQQINKRDYHFVVLGSDKGSATRRQFSVAHELGHIILHDWSTDLEVISREEFRQIEDEANQFAAAFLLPRDAFLSDLVYPNKLDFYIELKQKWRVSVSAMIVRAYQLKAISNNQYQYLMRQVSQRGWRTREPLDDTLQIAKPKVLRKAIELLKSSGVLTGHQLMAELSKNNISLNKKEVEFLLGLEDGFLTDDNQTSVVVGIRDRK